MLWLTKINTELDYCYLISYQQVHTLLATVNGNGHGFGHLCCRRTGQIREHAEVNRK
jgi:hypothetical protein